MSIWITGMGAISAAGSGSKALWESALSRTVNTRMINIDRVNKTKQIPVCPVANGDIKLPDFTGSHRLDRSAQMALCAGNEAWIESGLEKNSTDPSRVSVVIGTSRGPVGKWEEAYKRHVSEKRQLPTLAATGTIASLSGALAQHLEVTGTSLTVSSTCSSGASAIAIGANLIMSNSADVAVVGASEATLTPTVIGLMEAASLLGYDPIPERTCKPFDENRNGLMVGEGSGFLVLESSNHVNARNGPKLAKLSGWATGLSQSGKTGVEENGSGLAGIISDCIRMAQITTSEIGYINAHGTGTVLNDLCETRALQSLGDLKTIPCSSTKPVTGHCLGASPALEAILSVMSLRDGVAPPTANFEKLDPHIDLEVIQGAPRSVHLDHVISTSLGFWGNHACLAFSKI